MEFVAFLLFPIVVLIAIVGIYFTYMAQKRRREELRLLALELGFDYSAASDYAHDGEYAHFSIFQQGHSRCAYNTLAGAIEIGGERWPVRMGDFQYKVTSSNGKHTTTHTYDLSYAIVSLPYRQLPDLIVRREGVFDMVKNLFGFDDIDVESAEFSRRFCVQSVNRRFAYDVLHPRMIEFFLASDPPAVEIERDQCLVCEGTETWEPHEFRARLEWVRRFFELWPEHLTSQLETRSRV